MPQRARMLLEGLARQPGDAISIVATTEGGDAHVADAHRAARARHKRAPKCRSIALLLWIDIAQTDECPISALPERASPSRNIGARWGIGVCCSSTRNSPACVLFNEGTEAEHDAPEQSI